MYLKLSIALRPVNDLKQAGFCSTPQFTTCRWCQNYTLFVSGFEKEGVNLLVQIYLQVFVKHPKAAGNRVSLLANENSNYLFL